MNGPCRVVGHDWGGRSATHSLPPILTSKSSSRDRRGNPSEVEGFPLVVLQGANLAWHLAFHMVPRVTVLPCACARTARISFALGPMSQKQRKTEVNASLTRLPDTRVSLAGTSESGRIISIYFCLEISERPSDKPGAWFAFRGETLM